MSKMCPVEKDMRKVVSRSRNIGAINRHKIDAPAGVFYGEDGLDQCGRVQRFDHTTSRWRSDQYMRHLSSCSDWRTISKLGSRMVYSISATIRVLPVNPGEVHKQ